MHTRISKKKVFFRNLMAKFGLTTPLYKYDFSAASPKGIVSEWSEDGMIGRMEARDIIFKALKACSIDHVYYSWDTVKTNLKTLDRHLSIYPDSEYAEELKNAKGLQKIFWRFGGLLLGHDYCLYFENEADIVAFQIVR